ncbi:MAG: PA0069 family radical SAM protein [Marinosulfonomonas sp.]
MTSNSKTLPPHLRVPGRAAQSNAVGRFEPYERTVEHDGWDIPEDPQIVRTEVDVEEVRKIVTRNSSPDISFDRSINPYRGCEHGCIYCFARPTHAYLGLSPGLDFETRLVARPNAAARLKVELSRPNYEVKPIAIGTNTDAYQPIEARYKIMREILEVLSAFRHPVTIVTKGSLVERDIDILGEMGQAGLARVGISVTTLDPKISRVMEPRVPSPLRRLKTIERLSQAGCPVHVMVSPVVPALTDHDIETILAQAAKAGADAANWVMLRLPLEVSPLFQDWLAHHFPDRAARVMARVREMHGGQTYDAQWGLRMRGEGFYADLISQRFKLSARRHGLHHRPQGLRCDLFRVPGRNTQLSLF